MNKRSLVLTSVLFAVAGPLASLTQAQDQRAQMTTEEEVDIQFSLSGSAIFQSNTDIEDSNGDFDVSRLNLNLSLRVPTDDGYTFNFVFGAGAHNYDFAGAGFGGTDPWDDIETYDLAVYMNTDLSADWSLTVGAFVGVAAESGAGLSNSMTGGGMIAATFHQSNDLSIGGGIAAMSQIDDSMLVFPIISLNWKIDDQWTLTNADGSFHLGSPAGLELHYDLGNGWTISGGGAWNRYRFRLDDSGPAPEGVGEDSAFPVWIRFRWSPNPHSEVGAFVGSTLGGSLLLEDESGSEISDNDYDAAPVFGIYGSIRF